MTSEIHPADPPDTDVVAPPGHPAEPTEVVHAGEVLSQPVGNLERADGGDA